MVGRATGTTCSRLDVSRVDSDHLQRNYDDPPGHSRHLHWNDFQGSQTTTRLFGQEVASTTLDIRRRAFEELIKREQRNNAEYLSVDFLKKKSKHIRDLGRCIHVFVPHQYAIAQPMPQPELDTG